MRVQTEEWRRFIPGVRMYKGKMTLFYNGEILWEGNQEMLWDENQGRNRLHGHPLIYNWKERAKWEVIIVLPGVQVIPENTFGADSCCNVETVIMSDTVTRIGVAAFKWCRKLAFVKLSRNLEYIGHRAFAECRSLTSIFIPDSCRELGRFVFLRCQKLIILVVHPLTGLGLDIISLTTLKTKSIGGAVNAWIRTINDGAEYALHLLCSSMDPSEVEIYQMICEQGGLHAMARKNSIDISPSQYLAANPYADVDEMKLMKRFVLENMGEIV